MDDSCSESLPDVGRCRDLGEVPQAVEPGGGRLEGLLEQGQRQRLQERVENDEAEGYGRRSQEQHADASLTGFQSAADRMRRNFSRSRS
jgi:hypothetical protein